jgi:hypothetical protein
MLLDGIQEAGEHAVLWDGMSDDRRTVASGVYFYRLTVGDAASVQASTARKMLLLR